MVVYDVTANSLSIVGNIVLLYRFVPELKAKYTKRSRLIWYFFSWLNFLFFLKIESYLLPIVSKNLSFGPVLLLFFKTYLFLTEDTVRLM